tara:strand:+ start:631 stop:906 length:276 start_codon:yes stop_codon:yes gene_type:complete
MVFEAGIISFVRTLLIIALIYYGIKLIVRFLLPLVLRNFIKKQQDKFQNQYQNQQKKGNFSAKESSNDSASSKRKDKLGEYVDYEEVDDKE